ncbi:MAG: PD-(D/E)XK nuclease family protein, partial [Bacteroidales bacterium]
MKQFLYGVAEIFYHHTGENIHNYAFVFPNRRAGIFFSKYLGDIAAKPIFSPHIFTISDFFASLSPYQQIDRIETLFLIYKYFKHFSKSGESFDDFVYWGDVLINDFNDVDKYMVDASALFSNINELKEIESRFGSPLSDEQIFFIKRFCDNFNASVMTDKKQNFISLWSILYNVYSSLRQGLADEGKAYEGMLFRDVAGRAVRGELNIPYEKVVFIGFNVLTTAEESLMTSLKLSGKADFYWDNNAPTLKDCYNKANYFISDNIKKFPSCYKIVEPEITTYPHIEVIGVPSNIGQTKYAGEIISELTSDLNSASGCINTAVILPDERLLIPMLYSVPPYVNSINVTMGYPLGETSISGFFAFIFDLQKMVRKNSAGEVSFYHRNVAILLVHPYVKKLHGEIATAFYEEIKRGNKVYVREDEVPISLQYIFKSVNDLPHAVLYIKDIIKRLQSDGGDSNANTEQDVSCGISSIEKEFLYQYDITLNRLSSLSEGESIMVATFFRLLQKMASGTKVAFRGEPLSGLQIMGVLETRAIDFDNVIILSMNDGVFPVSNVDDTFIPYNLRRGFGLSVTEHRDSISAYYFYRLIARAKRVYLIYDTRTEGVRTGEVSRYVYQLKYQYMPQNDDQLIEKTLSYKINPGIGSEISVEKSGEVWKKLNMYLYGGEASLSASALNTYIDCPLKFYFNYVERIEEADDVSEDIDASAFGSIYHGVMQDIYQRIL